MNEQKNSFSGRIGFILAAAGSAVGLGNIWRFPYLAAKYGGGTFLLIYLILAVTFGFALMLTEIALGRKTGKSTLYAFTSLNKKYSFLGVLSSIVPIIIFPYYCVIGGWVAKYLFVYVTGQGLAATEDSFFTGFIGEVGQPLFWLFLFIAATAFIVMLGVEKGIEKASKILMPILVLLSLGIAVYVVTRPGAVDGLIYYIKPDFSEFSVNCVLAAMGQLFYSMSLAMGIMITYGSYMPKSENIESSVRSIELFDTGIAFISGMIIIPSVFVFSGGNKDILSSGPSLMFITLPKVFASMRAGAILGLSILDFFDFLSNSVLMPVVAFFTCIFVGFVVKPKVVTDEVKLSAPFKVEKLYVVLVKYVAPILIFLILISSIANTFGWISL